MISHDQFSCHELSEIERVELVKSRQRVSSPNREKMRYEDRGLKGDRDTRRSRRFDDFRRPVEAGHKRIRNIEEPEALLGRKRRPVRRNLWKDDEFGRDENFESFESFENGKEVRNTVWKRLDQAKVLVLSRNNLDPNLHYSGASKRSHAESVATSSWRPAQERKSGERRQENQNRGRYVYNLVQHKAQSRELQVVEQWSNPRAIPPLNLEKRHVTPKHPIMDTKDKGKGKVVPESSLVHKNQVSGGLQGDLVL
ncbi:unnamed protein product [Cochlearia groenlandica]